jgi:hypothetical protein
MPAVVGKQYKIVLESRGGNEESNDICLYSTTNTGIVKAVYPVTTVSHCTGGESPSRKVTQEVIHQMALI